MKSAKTFIAFTFLLAFAFQVLAQEQTPKIVWKNLQEKYESFQTIKPIIVNISNSPIYFDCDLAHFEQTNLYRYVENSDNTKLLYLDNESNIWNWNVMICGTVTKEEKNQLKRKYKETEKLQKQGKYLEKGCKINPKEEYVLNFNNEQWKKLIYGDGIGPTYKSGKFKFEINYWWYNSYKDKGKMMTESPEFEVMNNNFNEQ